MTADDVQRWRKATTPKAKLNVARTIFKVVLVLWTLAYPVVSCSPFLLGPTDAMQATATGIGSILIGGILFFPWIIGIVILGVLVAVTRSD